METPSTAIETAFTESGVAHFSLLDLAGAIVAGFLGMVVSLAAYYVALMLNGVPVTALRTIAHSTGHLSHMAVIAALAGYAAVFGFLLWRGIRRGLSAREMGFGSFAGRWLVAAVLAVFVLRFISGVLHLTLSNADIDRSVSIAKSMLPGGLAWNIATAVMIVIVAPLAEEFFFRVALFSSLMRFVSRFAAAGLVVVLFAALHFQYSTIGGRLALVLTSDVGLLGAVLMWLYIRSGSIWPSVLLHAFNNGLTLAALLAFFG